MNVLNRSDDFCFLKSEDWASEWEYLLIYRRSQREATRRYSADPRFASYGD